MPLLAMRPDIMSNDVKQNLKRQSTWTRGLYMLIYLVFRSIADIVLFNSDYQPYPFGAWPKGEPKAVKRLEQGDA